MIRSKTTLIQSLRVGAIFIALWMGCASMAWAQAEEEVTANRTTTAILYPLVGFAIFLGLSLVLRPSQRFKEGSK